MPLHTIPVIYKKLKCYFGEKGPGRDLQVRPDDKFIVSFPKSGNTWVRHMLACIIAQKNEISFEEMDHLVPDIYVRNLAVLERMRSPRIMKSHEYFHPSYRKMVYIVRDPRDVLLSLYHHRMRWEERSGKVLDMNVFGREFLSGMTAYGTWAENVGSWWGARGEDHDALFIRYEDLLTTTDKVLMAVLDHLYISHSKELIRTAVEGSSLARLQEKEKKEKNTWNVAKNAYGKGNFFRKGTSGQWEKTLPAELVETIEKKWSRLMRQFGYK